MSQLILTRSPNSAMLNLIFLDLGNVCRLCLTAANLSVLEDTTPLKTFATTASVEVKLEDEFPKKMCAKCLAQMQQTTQFITQCKLTQTLLKGVVTIPKGAAGLKPPGAGIFNSSSALNLLAPLVNPPTAVTVANTPKVPTIAKPVVKSPTKNIAIASTSAGISPIKTAAKTPIIINNPVARASPAVKKYPIPKNPKGAVTRKRTPSRRFQEAQNSTATPSTSKAASTVAPKKAKLAKKAVSDTPQNNLVDNFTMECIFPSARPAKSVPSPKSSSRTSETMVKSSPKPSELSVKTIAEPKLVETPRRLRKESSLCERCGMVTSEKHSEFKCAKCNFSTCAKKFLTQHAKTHTAKAEVAPPQPKPVKKIEPEIPATINVKVEYAVAPSIETEAPEASRVFDAHPNPPTKCPKCGQLVRSLNKHRKANRICWKRCSYCKYECWKESAMKLHELAKHTNNRVFACDQCDSTFKYKWNLNRHQKVHQELDVEDCKVCGKRFMNKSNLDEHMNTHNGLKPYLCQHCGRSFTTNGQKQTHISRYHGAGERNAKSDRVKRSKMNNYLCWYCGKHFQNYHIYYHHMYVHKTVKNYLCELCSFRTSSPHILKIHTKSHSNEVVPRLYKCPICSKEFKQERNLENHRKTHENHEAKPEVGGQLNAKLMLNKVCIFSCKQCKITFTEDIERKMHTQFCNGPIEVKLLNR